MTDITPNAVTVDTPVDLVLNAGKARKALIIRLASLVFDKSEGKIIKAYTQFRPEDLGALIEAKRKGVFDYGETIRKLSIGAWVFPKDPAAVLKALDLADRGEFDDIDLESLHMLEDGKPVCDLKRLLPSMKKAKTTTRKAPKVEAPPVEEKEKEEEKETPKRVQRTPPKTARKSQKVETPTPEAVEPEVRVVPASIKGVEDVRADIAELSTNLGEALETMHKATAEKLEALAGSHLDQGEALIELAKRIRLMDHNIQVVAQGLKTVSSNLEHLAMYFIDPDLQFEEVNLDFLGDLPEEVDDEDDTGAEEPTEAEVVADEASDAASDAADADEDGAGDDGDEDVFVRRYTREELEDMELTELRRYAESIGAKPSRLHSTVVNRVLAEYKRQDNEA